MFAYCFISREAYFQWLSGEQSEKVEESTGTSRQDKENGDKYTYSVKARRQHQRFIS